MLTSPKTQNSYRKIPFMGEAKEQREPVIFQDVYPHAIRHTFCSRCFEKDINPKVVQALMGHRHYSTTIEIYTHVTERKFNEEVAKFGMAVEDDEGIF